MKTLDYNKFKFLTQNRDIHQSKVDNIAESIKEIGFLESRAILIDRNWYVIDGQHRLNACIKLGIPAVYEVCDIDTNRAMILLNKTQQIWRLDDYIKSYAKQGIECYQYLVNFEQKYKLGISNSIICCMSSNGRNASKIRNGEVFKINKNSVDVANFLLNCKPFFHFYLNKNFVQAVENCFTNLDEKNINKLFSRISSIQQQPSVSDYLIVFENILNKNKKNSDVLIKLRTLKIK